MNNRAFERVTKCIFCGRHGWIMVVTDSDIGTAYFHIECDYCGARGAKHTTTEKAKREWKEILEMVF